MSSKLIAYIADGSAIEDPTLLFQFFMLTFADLKSYQFTYWYCAPTLVPEVPFQASENKTKNFRDAYPDQLVYLYKNLLEYWSLETISSDKPHCKQICMIETQNSSQEPRIVSLRDGWARRYDHGSFIVLFDTTLVGKDSTVSSSSVSSSTSEFQGSHSDESTFGWSTRNALSLLALSHDQSSTQSYINIVSVRGPLWEKLLHSWTVGQKDSTWRASVDSLTPSDTCKFILLIYYG